MCEIYRNKYMKSYNIKVQKKEKITIKQYGSIVCLQLTTVPIYS